MGVCSRLVFDDDDDDKEEEEDPDDDPMGLFDDEAIEDEDETLRHLTCTRARHMCHDRRASPCVCCVCVQGYVWRHG